VLPSKTLLLIYAAILSVLLSLAARGGSPDVPAFVASFLVAVLTSAVVSSSARLADSGSIATFRRATAVVFAGDAVWLFCLACGLVYSYVAGSSQPLGNALFFGALVCGGFEFIVINGAFTTSTPVALPLAVLHPLLTVLAFALTGAVTAPTAYAVVFGLLGSGVLVLFILSLKRRRMDGNDDAVRLFQAFMKTWAGRNAADLEAITAKHAARREVSTKVLRFHRQGGDIYLVLPGVHPGPFYPVGSYNLPSLMYRKFSEAATVLTLHGPGGHENNLATTADTQQFVSDVYQFSQSVTTPFSPALLKGPISTRIGRANVSCFSLGADAILTVSFAPFGSDDLDASVGEELSKLVQPSGLQLSVVDGHNSIEPRPESLDLHDPLWKELFQKLAGASSAKLRVAAANSHELSFASGHDVSEGGLSLLMLEADGVKWTLVLADSNNATSTLRGAVSDALSAAGYALLEFCTSDSHELAARGLTVNRGYLALGEATPQAEITRAVVELARMADTRLAECSYGSGTLVKPMNTLGTKALEEFERVTDSSVRFARRYTAFAAGLTLILLALALAV
jgi:putative membrane protein